MRPAWQIARDDIVLSVDAQAVIAGLAEIGDEFDGGVNHDGIMAHSDVWDEIRRAFPSELFWAWVNEAKGEEHDDVRYIAEAGM